MKNVMISFIVPVYNTALYLDQCLKSLIVQSRQDIEIIVVNDGSTDDSLEICKKYEKLDDRMTVINQNNQGVSVARNKGLEEACGKWICFVDSDDYMDNNFTDSIFHYLDTSFDVIYFGYRTASEKRKEQVIENSSSVRKLNKDDFRNMQKIIFNAKTPEKKYSIYAGIPFTAPWGKCYRKDFLDEINARFITGVKRSQDALFNVYVCTYAKSGLFISNTLYNYRVFNDSVCRRYHSDALKTVIDLIQYYKEYLNQISDSTASELNEMIVRQLMYCIVLDFCHKDNTDTYKKRREKFLNTLDMNFFQTAIHNVELRNFCVQEKVVVFLIRIKCFRMIDILNKARMYL